MRQLVFIAFLSLFTAPATFAEAPYEAWWQKGIVHFQQQEYDSAVFYFEKVAADNPQSAEVYFNLGNSYYRLNQIGPAVLNFERALHLEPAHQQAQDNLSLTQGRIANRIPQMKPIFFVDWWKTITASNKANAWAAISLALFLVWLGMLMVQRLGKIKALPPKIGPALLSLWLICLILAAASAMHKSNSGRAVVMVPDAEMLAMPEKGKVQSLIPEGTTVELESTRDGWAEVQLPDGRIGWMQKDKLSKI